MTDSGWRPFLLWREGDKVYLGMCNSASTLRNREACSQRLRSLDAKAVYEQVVTYYRGPIEQAETLITESYVNIQLIHNRTQTMIDQEVSASGRPAAGQALLDAVVQMRIDLAEEELGCTELREQVARLEQSLIEAPSTDLTEQLYAVRKQLGIKEAVANDLKNRIAEQYKQYIALNAQLLDPVIYSGLQRQRDIALRNLATGRANAEKAITAATNGALTIRLIDDHSFAYVLGDGAYLEAINATLYIYNSIFR